MIVKCVCVFDTKLQVLTGVLMNIMCVGIVLLALNTTGIPIFGLSTFPTDVLGNCTLSINGSVY